MGCGQSKAAAAVVSKETPAVSSSRKCCTPTLLARHVIANRIPRFSDWTLLIQFFLFGNDFSLHLQQPQPRGMITIVTRLRKNLRMPPTEAPSRQLRPEHPKLRQLRHPKRWRSVATNLPFDPDIPRVLRLMTDPWEETMRIGIYASRDIPIF